ncbi:MAG TPA: TIGR03435 family protein [Vicinamibacterales bacterium]
MLRACALTLLLVPSASAFAQEALRFEVASVKANVGTDRSIPFRMPPPDGITLTNNPLESIIRYAYNVQPFRLIGVPAWTREERYDIAAKAARPISEDERRLMMRALLVDRFHLNARFESRTQTVYVMKPVRADQRLGPGLKPRPDCNSTQCESGGTGRNDSIRVGAVTLTRLAEGMLSTVRGELVVNETGIPGTFDVELSWRPETSTDANDGRPAFSTALQEQLGLKLEPQRRPVDVLVVQSIERPTPD